MKLVLEGFQGSQVSIMHPAQRTLKALTHGGFGKLPGDAVTSDLAENEAKKIAVAASMPIERAVENMVRSGFEADFATKWCKALIAGGETDATGLGMMVTKTFPEGGEHVAVSPETIWAQDRFFRNAWRKDGEGIIIDLAAARAIFADKVLAAVAVLQGQVKADEKRVLLLGASPEFDARLEALAAVDLRKIGKQLGVARSPEEIRALWPDALKV